MSRDLFFTTAKQWVRLFSICSLAWLPFVHSAHAAPEVVAWGANFIGQTTVPLELSNVVSVAAGRLHNLALQADGKVLGWGYNSFGQSSIPTDLTNVVAIAAGYEHSLALRSDGRVISWGRQTNVPSGLTNVVAIAAGHSNSLALQADGRVIMWGTNGLPSNRVRFWMGNVVAIASGAGHSVALDSDGRVTAWGYNNYGQTNVPPGLSNVIAIAAAGDSSLALRVDGTVVVWGTNYYSLFAQAGLISNAAAISAGYFHANALLADGRAVSWGYNYFGQTNVPVGLSNVVATAGGESHTLALVGLPPNSAPPQFLGTPFLIGTADNPFFYRPVVRNGASSYAAQGLPAGLNMDPITGIITGTTAEPGIFPVALSATNGMGRMEWPVTLYINSAPPRILSADGFQCSLGVEVHQPTASFNAPTWFGATDLPPGLSIDAATGTISGKPEKPGLFFFTLNVSNRFGSAAGLRSISVAPVLAWGDNSVGQTNIVSTTTNPVSIAAGGTQSYLWNEDGQAVGWGTAPWSLAPYLTNLAAMAVGPTHFLTLSKDRHVSVLSSSPYAITNIPSDISNVVSVAAGRNFNVVLMANGKVRAWGRSSDDYGETNVPTHLGPATAIAVGSAYKVLALQADGHVVAWGSAAKVPADLHDIVAIAAGSSANLALRSDGRVFAWGGGPQTNVPPDLTNGVAIAAGGQHCVALRADGHMVVWGSNAKGQTQVGDYSNIAAIAAGEDHSIALLSAPPGRVRPEFLGDSVALGMTGARFFYRVATKNGTESFSAEGLPPGLSIDPVQGIITGIPTQAGSFSVLLVATNAAGRQERIATLIINEPPLSKLTLTLTNDECEITFSAEGGHFYRLLSSTNLVDWQTNSGISMTSNGVAILRTPKSEKASFYRVRME